MARHYGIPYMGSKQKLVDKIVPFILKRHPDTTHFYDLFGGGGSVSLYAVRKYPNLNVHYNELSLAISSLMEHLKEGGEIPFDFYTKDEFESMREGSDWHTGLMQVCWTFGNNTKHYLYARSIQDFKHKLHDLVMTGQGNFGELEALSDKLNLQEWGKEVNTKIYLNPAIYDTPYRRRIVLARQIPNLGAMQHIGRLERLVQISNMPGISNLIITKGKSYDQAPINQTKSVVYCDPPYEATAEYAEGNFSSKQFYDWVAEQKVPVYFSSYKISDDRFKLVKAINTRSLLNQHSRKDSPHNYENLYWNGVGDA